MILPASCQYDRFASHRRYGGLTPDDPDLVALDCALRTVDVGHTLASVPLSRSGAINALELQERRAGIGVTLSSLVAVRVVSIAVGGVDFGRTHEMCLPLT
jgi:hypothetical protein